MVGWMLAFLPVKGSFLMGVKIPFWGWFIIELAI
jgi:hypothetical protein